MPSTSFRKAIERSSSPSLANQMVDVASHPPLSKRSQEIVISSTFIETEPKRTIHFGENLYFHPQGGYPLG